MSLGLYILLLFKCTIQACADGVRRQKSNNLLIQICIIKHFIAPGCYVVYIHILLFAQLAAILFIYVRATP